MTKEDKVEIEKPKEESEKAKYSTSIKIVAFLTMAISLVSLFALIPVFLFTTHGNITGALIAFALASFYSIASTNLVLRNKGGIIAYYSGVLLSFVVLLSLEIFALEKLPEIMHNIAYVWACTNFSVILLSITTVATLSNQMQNKENSDTPQKDKEE